MEAQMNAMTIHVVDTLLGDEQSEESTYIGHLVNTFDFILNTRKK